MKSTFFVLLIIFLFLFYPLIRANYDYADDLLRKCDGSSCFYLWSNSDGAHIATVLEYILLCGTFPLDFSPLGQIVAIVFLSLSGVILINVFSSKNKFDIFNVFSVLVVGLTPSFLECMSYKYDSAIFGMAVFLSVLPLAFYKEKSYIYILIASISLFFSFMSYHAASGIFIVSVIFLSLCLFIKYHENSLILKIILKSVLSYFIASIAFYFSLIITSYFCSNFTASRTNFSFKTMFPTLLKIYNFFNYSWNSVYKLGLLFVLIVFVLGLFFNTKRNKIATFCFIIFSLILVFIFQFGVSQLIVEDARIAERYYFGCGVTIAIILLLCNEFRLKYKKILVICLLFMAGFAISALKYGNYLYNQKRYTFNKVYPLINILNNNLIRNTNYNIGIIEKELGLIRRNVSYENNDACLGVFKPLFSTNEPRLIRFYFPEEYVRVKGLDMLAYNNFQVNQYVSNLKILDKNKYFQIEEDEGGNVQVIVKR